MSGKGAGSRSGRSVNAPDSGVNEFAYLESRASHRIERFGRGDGTEAGEVEHR